MSFSHDKIAGLKIKDEGVTIANPAQSLDFVGAGVAATTSGGDVTATISGSGVTEVRNEVPTDNADGTFTLANTPTAGTVNFFKNGQKLTLTTDWSIATATITLNATNSPYEPGQVYTVDYQHT